VGTGRELPWHFPLCFRTSRLVNFLSAWRWHKQAGRSSGAMLLGDFWMLAPQGSST